MRRSFSAWLPILSLAALLAAPQSAMGLEAVEAETLPPAFAGKAVGPMAKAGTALRRLFGEHRAHAQRGRAGPFVPSNRHLQYMPETGCVIFLRYLCQLYLIMLKKCHV